MSPRELRLAAESNTCSDIINWMTPPDSVDLDPADIHQMENLRRSIAMGQPEGWALKREPALSILGQLLKELGTSRVQRF